MYDRGEEYNKMMKTEITTLTETCKKCSGIEVITVETQDLHEWKAGKFIQEAMSYLTADQRELLISGICGSCFDSMFDKDFQHGDRFTEEVNE